MFSFAQREWQQHQWYSGVFSPVADFTEKYLIKVGAAKDTGSLTV